MRKSTFHFFLTFVGLVCWAGLAGAQSGQVAIGRSTVEPALNAADGSEIFLMTPDKVPFPSKANGNAVAPMYLTMYPGNSTVNPISLNCQPSNCDHLNVLPFPAPGYPNGGATCTKYGMPANSCALVIGHDHIVGIPPTGDYNVAWHVRLIVFTQDGIAAGKANIRAMTLMDINNLIAGGYATEAETPITFNCQKVSSTVYYRGTPLSF